MKTGKFNVGNSVVAYDVCPDPAHTLKEIRGTVMHIFASGALCIEFGDPLNYWIAHPKECRLLVKQTRRRVWFHSKELKEISNGIESYYTATAYTNPDSIEGMIEFVEVVRKKR